MTMQTRARGKGPVSPPRPSTPLLSRRTRKRASSNGNAPSKQTDSSNGEDTANAQTIRLAGSQPRNQNKSTNGVSNDTSAAQTPRHAKRVRFSDPGAITNATYGDDLEPATPGGPGGRFTVKNNNSTGLTPAVGRTKLDPKSKKKAAGLSTRRKTLPANIDNIAEEGDESLPSPPQTAKINRIQFLPLREVLDQRIKRRLRRSHLSEELNDIEAEKKDMQRSKKELASLREHQAESEDKIAELMYELESQRLFKVQVGTEETQEADTMREELERLRQEVAAGSGVVGQGQQVAADNSSDIDEDLGFNSVPASPVDAYLSGSSPVQAEKSDWLHTPTIPKTSDQGTQAGTSSLTWSFQMRGEIQSLNEQIAEATRESCEAQQAFNHIQTQLRSLGFAAEDADANESIAAINNTFRTARLELERMLPGETAPGFENAAVVPVLINHIGLLVQHLRNVEREIHSHSQSEKALKRNFDDAIEKARHLDNRLTTLLAYRDQDKQLLALQDQRIEELAGAARARVTAIDERDDTIQRLQFDLKFNRQQLQAKESQVDRLKSTGHESEVTIERLQGAIESYRKEVYSLEALVTSMDAEKETAQSNISESDSTMKELTAKARDLEQKNAKMEDELREAKAVLENYSRKTHESLDGAVKEHDEASKVVTDFLRVNY
ncbi:MAG: hypothetical protein M1831_006600 [Alyxoria varia]|nr:MAG: hypothetical protein M1831_006600 [Alyxoria varia]